MTANRALLAVILAAAAPAFAQPRWPDLSHASARSGGGEKDAAVIVGLENYAAVAAVPGALKNADDWHEYLTDALGVPLDKVALLRDGDATLETMRDAARKAAASVEPGGTLWFVYIGHGAPTKDGKDGLLVGWDAQQRADSLFSRSLPQKELLRTLGVGRQARTLVLIDACFSGRTASGAPLVPGLQPLIVKMGDAPSQLAAARAVVLTAAHSDQFAGPLPGAARPAFSYLALGGLRGWAADADGKVTAERLVAYVAKTLRAFQTQQQPELSSYAPGQVLATAHENAPDLGELVRSQPQTGPRGSPAFQLTALEEVPRAAQPKALDEAATGVDFASVDVDSLEKYDMAVKYEKSAASPSDKAANWRALPGLAPKFADVSARRAAEWNEFAERQKAIDAALDKRRSARDADWSKLGRLLALGVVPEADKRKWAREFSSAYMRSPGLEPAMVKDISNFLTPGQRIALKAHSTEPRSAAGSTPDSFADIARRKEQADRAAAERDAEQKRQAFIGALEGGIWLGQLRDLPDGWHHRLLVTINSGRLAFKGRSWRDPQNEPSAGEGAEFDSYPLTGRAITVTTSGIGPPSCNPVTFSIADDLSRIVMSLACGGDSQVFTRR